MIKIINGTYGHFENGRVIPKTAESLPFSPGEKKEAELVELGIAECVSADEIPEHEEERPAYSDKMKFEELKEAALLYGVDASDARSKKEVIEMIEAAEAEEAPPSLKAADPVA